MRRIDAVKLQKEREMSGALVLFLTMGAIMIARAKFGDQSYEAVVGAILKWIFAPLAIFALIAFFSQKFFGEG